MPMSSNQIAGMLAQQNQMFGGIASYAQQITPPMGMFNQGPAPAQPPMPTSSAWSPNMMGGMAMPFGPPSAGGAQAMGQSITGTALAGASTAMRGLDTASTMAGVGATGLGMMGVGGGAAATMGLLSAGPVSMAATAGVHATQQAYAGFQERSQVDSVLRSRFGNVQGIGQGRGGRGFSGGEAGGISTMLREMGTEDLTSNMEELTRVMDKTAGMGLFRGVQSAREFKNKFKKTVDGLKEMAEIMHTTLEGATQFMGQQRGMGIFSGKDISKQLALTRTMSSVTGMSIDQVGEMAQQGAQMARATGGRGKAGAQAGVLAGGKFAMAQKMGILSDEDVAFATGGLTGAEGAQAMGGRMMQSSMRFMQRGAGRAMVAGLWDQESGGINQERLQQAMSGEIGIRELRNQGRKSIKATGGRRSEFFRDEEQLRSQVLSQGGEYLPMAIYGTHLAEKRGLELDDPIVQRSMRRKFRMNQGEVENATKMMQNMPEIQAQMITQGRATREEEQAGAGQELRGIQGLGKRLGQVWEKEVQNKFRQFGDDLSTDISTSIEGIVDTMEGRVTAQMSSASRLLLAEKSEFGKAVSKEAQGAASFGHEEYQKFMKMPRNKAFDRREAVEQQVGKLFGLRPDDTGAGRKMYEGGFGRAGKLFTGEALGIPEFLQGSRRGGQDIGVGLRGLAQESIPFTGGASLEGMWENISGYDPRKMSRIERGRALGFDEEFKGEEGQQKLNEFLRGAETQMARSSEYSRTEQESMGKEYANLMYSTLENTEVFNGWRKNYQKGFMGVKNSLARMERWGSPELKAAAAKARKGTRAEQVAFTRTMEEGGDIQSDYRVTDELSTGMGSSDLTADYEKDIRGIKSRRAEALAGLEEHTQAESRGAGQTILAKGARGAVTALTGIGAGYALDWAMGTNVAEAAENAILGIGDDTSISGRELTSFLADSDVREAYVQWQSGGSKEAKDAGRNRLIGLKDSMSDEGQSVFDRLKRINTSSDKKGKSYLKTVADSFNAEGSRASLEVENDLGRSLSAAMEGASLPSMGDAGREAWGKLQNVAKLRSSQRPGDVDESFRLEAELMDEIVGTQAGKDVMKGLQGQEGGEFVLAGLTGAEGYFRKFGGGKRRRGLTHKRKVSNIIGAALGTAGLDLGDTRMLQAFGDDGKMGKESDIVSSLARGGEESERAMAKILATAQSGGMKGAQLSQLEQRLSGVGRALKDRKVTDEEARELAGGLGGRIAGGARAKGRTEKTATEDSQKVANKHLKSIDAAIVLMASGNADKKIELGDDTVKTLRKLMSPTPSAN